MLRAVIIGSVSIRTVQDRSVPFRHKNKKGILRAQAVYYFCKVIIGAGCYNLFRGCTGIFRQHSVVKVLQEDRLQDPEE